MNWEMHPDTLKVDQNIQTRMQGWDNDANVGIEIRVSPKAMLRFIAANDQARRDVVNDQARRDAFLANLDTIVQVAQKRYNAPDFDQSDDPIIIELDSDDFESVS